MRTISSLVAVTAFFLLGSAADAAKGPKPAKPAEADKVPEAPAEPAEVGTVTDEEGEAAILKQQAEFESKLTFRTGKISLVGGKVQLDLPEGYRYLNAADADKVLVLWGNPPGQRSQGMFFPKGAGIWDDSLAIVIDYVDDGHVSDDDAAKVNYTELLEQMRTSGRADNAERKKAGLATMELTGWAEPPHYDKATRKLYWAKDLQVSDHVEHTLNYAVRVLGREGTLELNAIAGMEALPQVKQEMQTVIAFSDFTTGNRYTDYKHGVDRSAGYGIAAVVAGGVAAKVIGSKGLIALLLAGKKFIVLALVGIAAAVKKFWARVTGRPDPQPPAA